MIAQDILRAVVTKANLAPSIHNAQPARWRLTGEVLEIAADLAVRLPQADPDGRGIALSMGAAVEATVLALGSHDHNAQITMLWDAQDCDSWPGHRIAARLHLHPGQPSKLAQQLEARQTWRGAFADEVPQLFGWTRPDTLLVMDEASRAEIAAMNDAAALGIMRQKPFRQELLSWMRLTPKHPRYQYDGLNTLNLRLDKGATKTVRLGLGPLWGMLDMTGRTAALTAEAPLTMTAPIIALFHAETGACPLQTGRDYLRMWLEATQLGLSGWPMAALSDDPETRATIAANWPLGPHRELIQAIRFGIAPGPRPPRSRRPIREILS